MILDAEQLELFNYIFGNKERVDIIQEDKLINSWNMINRRRTKNFADNFLIEAISKCDISDK